MSYRFRISKQGPLPRPPRIHQRRAKGVDQRKAQAPRLPVRPNELCESLEHAP